MSATDRGTAEPPPLTPAAFHILLVLGDGPQHGYGVMRDVELLTGGAFRLGPGTLYRSLEVMTLDGLIEEVAEPGRAAVDERRRVFRLTALGRETVRAEARRLEQLVKIARRRGLLASPGDRPRRQAEWRAR
jgi:DNA-binding PadR family transcriptional regulator